MPSFPGKLITLLSTPHASVFTVIPFIFLQQKINSVGAGPVFHISELKSPRKLSDSQDAFTIVKSQKIGPHFVYQRELNPGSIRVLIRRHVLGPERECLPLG